MNSTQRWRLYERLICPPTADSAQGSPATSSKIARKILDHAFRRSLGAAPELSIKSFFDFRPNTGWITAGILEQFLLTNFVAPITLEYVAVVAPKDLRIPHDGEYGRDEAASLFDEATSLLWEKVNALISSWSASPLGNVSLSVTADSASSCVHVRIMRGNHTAQLSFYACKSPSVFLSNQPAREGCFDVALAFFALPHFYDDWRKEVKALHKLVRLDTGVLHYGEMWGDSAGWFYAFDNVDLASFDIEKRETNDWQRMLYLLTMRRFHWACKIEGWHAERAVTKARHETVSQYLSRRPRPMHRFDMEHGGSRNYIEFAFERDSSLLDWLDATVPHQGDPIIGTIAPPVGMREKIRADVSYDVCSIDTNDMTKRDSLISYLEKTSQAIFGKSAPIGKGGSALVPINIRSAAELEALDPDEKKGERKKVDAYAQHILFHSEERFRLISLRFPHDEEMEPQTASDDDPLPSAIRIESSIANRIDQEFGAAFNIFRDESTGEQTPEREIMDKAASNGLYQLMHFGVIPDPIAVLMLTDTIDGSDPERVSQSNQFKPQQYAFCARVGKPAKERDGRRVELCFKHLIAGLLKDGRSSRQATLVHTFYRLLPEKIIVNTDIVNTEKEKRKKFSQLGEAETLRLKPVLRPNGAIHLLQVILRDDIALQSLRNRVNDFFSSVGCDAAVKAFPSSPSSQPELPRQHYNHNDLVEAMKAITEKVKRLSDSELFDTGQLTNLQGQLRRLFLTFAIFRENGAWYDLARPGDPAPSDVVTMARELASVAALPLTRTCHIPSRDSREVAQPDALPERRPALGESSSANPPLPMVLQLKRWETSVGALVVNFDREFDPNTGPIHPSTELRIQNAIGLRNRALYQTFEKQRQSLRLLTAFLTLAISRVMMRNMSHNLGSHILPRSGYATLERRILELEKSDHMGTQNRGGRMAGMQLSLRLMDALQTYMSQKEEFISQITTDKSINTRPAWFYRDVILPFIENTLILDNLAANERYRHCPLPHEKSLTIHVRINGKEIGAAYSANNANNGDKTVYYYPPRPGQNEQVNRPYSLGFPVLAHLETGRVQRTFISLDANGSIDKSAIDGDVEIELPGQQGQFAIYSLLENYIRNVAKHGKDADVGTEGETELKIYLDLDTREKGRLHSAKDESSHYRLRISDNLHQFPCVEQVPSQFVELYERLNGYLRMPVTDKNGELRTQSWGIAEMHICALLLNGAASSSDFIELRTPKKKETLALHLRKWSEMFDEAKRNEIRLHSEVREGVFSPAKIPVNETLGLQYELNLLRPRRALLIRQSPEREGVQEEKLIAFEDYGFSVISTPQGDNLRDAPDAVAEVSAVIRRTMPGASFRFCLARLADDKEMEGLLANLPALRHLLPFRFILSLPTGIVVSDPQWRRFALADNHGPEGVQGPPQQFARFFYGDTETPETDENDLKRAYRWMWRLWMRRWESGVLSDSVDDAMAAATPAQPLCITLYLEQKSDESPTREWIAYADAFNDRQQQEMAASPYLPPVFLQVYCMDKKDDAGDKKDDDDCKSIGDATRGTRRQPLPAPPRLNLLLDRHQTLSREFENSTIKLWKEEEDSRPANEIRFYQELSKITPDMGPLFDPAFPAPVPSAQTGQRQDAPPFPPDDWTLPYEIAEAGLLRILVIDERAAELAYNRATDSTGMNGANWAMPPQEKGEGEFINVWQQNYAAGVYIATEFCVTYTKKNIGEQTAEKDADDRLKECFHDTIAARRKEPGNKPLLKVEVDLDKAAQGCLPDNVLTFTIQGGSPLPRPDMVIIHQGLFDRDSELFGEEGEKLLSVIRQSIPWVIVTSGRGPLQPVSLGEKFVPFSLLKELLLSGAMGKFTFTRNVMQLRRRQLEEH